MTTKLSKTELVNDNSEIILSYQTLEEKTKTLKSLGQEWFSSIKTEKDIYLQRGRILREIANNKLYKIKFNKETNQYEEIENRKFEDFLQEDSKEYFKRHKPLALKTAIRYQAFHLLCNEILHQPSMSAPILITQIEPMADLILSDLDKAVEVWKGAYDSCKKDYPTQDEVYQAFIVYGPRDKAKERAFNAVKREYDQAVSEKEKTYEEPEINKPTISISELQKYDGSVDAGLTCKAIASSYHQAKESLSSFKFTLYNFIQENGIEALNELKNIDVGVYSINDLDIKVKGLEEELIKIKLMLDS